MKANINPDLCTGCEECIVTCPDVFELNLTSYLADVKLPEIPAEAEDRVSSAATECPMGAISLNA